jgi:hypothetical protein
MRTLFSDFKLASTRAADVPLPQGLESDETFCELSLDTHPGHGPMRVAITSLQQLTSGVRVVGVRGKSALRKPSAGLAAKPS